MESKAIWPALWGKDPRGDQTMVGRSASSTVGWAICETSETLCPGPLGCPMTRRGPETGGFVCLSVCRFPNVRRQTDKNHSPDLVATGRRFERSIIRWAFRHRGREERPFSEALVAGAEVTSCLPEKPILVSRLAPAEQRSRSFYYECGGTNPTGLFFIATTMAATGYTTDGAQPQGRSPCGSARHTGPVWRSLVRTTRMPGP
jgi:hypothetical protein